MDAGYVTEPSQLQLASFGTELVKAINNRDVKKLDALLSAGLSPNPCNKFKDSVLFDLVCKRANMEAFRVFLKHGCNLRVCDDFGRTPLHYCAWANEFCEPMAAAILHADWIQILIQDKRGKTPLEYVHPDLVLDWIEFLESTVHWWAPSAPTTVNPPRLYRHMLPDPSYALPVQVAAALSGGEISPEHAGDTLYRGRPEQA
jgi:hypothetical protein